MRQYGMSRTPRGQRLAGVLATLSLVSLVLAASPARAGELRIATLAPEGSSWMVILRKAAHTIADATANRVTLKYYPGGQQGDERDVVRKMKVGQLDGSALTGTGLSLIDESIRILELPMLFKDTKELDCVREKIWPDFQKRFAKKGFILGEAGDVGFIYFYSKKPVRSLADLKSAKVWMWTDDRIVRAVYKQLGINGVPMGVPDVKAALQTPRLDAAYGSPLSTVALQWNTSVKYVTSMPMTYALGASVIRKDVFDKISATDQATIRRLLEDTGRKIRKTVRRDNRKAQRAMKRSGVTTIETPAPLVAEFTKASQEVWHQLAGSVYSKDQLNKVLAYRAQCRK